MKFQFQLSVVGKGDGEGTMKQRAKRALKKQRRRRTFRAVQSELWPADFLDEGPINDNGRHEAFRIEQAAERWGKLPVLPNEIHDEPLHGTIDPKGFIDAFESSGSVSPEDASDSTSCV